MAGAGRVDAAHLDRVQVARAAGAGPDLSAGLVIDIDATITIAHSEKENAAKTWKKTFGFHPLLAYLDRPDVAGGEALAGLLRPGNAGSNTAADHVRILDLAIAALPAHARPRRDDQDGPRLLVRTDAAGATHRFAAALRERGCGFSLGFAVDEDVQAAARGAGDGVDPGLRQRRRPRAGAWVAEITGCLDLRTCLRSRRRASPA